jgi:hypothetical protein
MPSFANPDHSFFATVQSPSVQAGVAAGTLRMGDPLRPLYITAGATLGSLTVLLPAANPGQRASVTSQAAITTLTLQNAAGGAVAGAPTTAVANTEIRMMYVNSTVGWVWLH